MSRRARSRNMHPRRAGPVVLDTMALATAKAAKLSALDVQRQHTITQRALAAFCRGEDCNFHWMSLADTANMAETLAAMGLGSGPDADRVIQGAQMVLHDVYRRQQERGSWTLYADEIDALHWLVALHCGTQLPACSYGEFEQAVHRTAERMQQARAGNAPAGAIVIVGAIDSRRAVEAATC